MSQKRTLVLYLQRNVHLQMLIKETELKNIEESVCIT